MRKTTFALLLLILAAMPVRAQTEDDLAVQTQERIEPMIMTVLDARLEPEMWEPLKQAFAVAEADLPPQLLETLLIHSTIDEKTWRIISIWESQAALDAYEDSVDTPAGVRIFRAAGVEPARSRHEVFSRLLQAR